VWCKHGSSLFPWWGWYHQDSLSSEGLHLYTVVLSRLLNQPDINIFVSLLHMNSLFFVICYWNTYCSEFVSWGKLVLKLGVSPSLIHTFFINFLTFTNL
jgi:hypothetical protein